MRKFISFSMLSAALTLAACGGPVISLPPITPQQVAGDVAGLASTAGRLLPLLDPSMPVGKASQIQADIAIIRATATVLSNSDSFDDSALKNAETAMNDLIAIGSDPAILAVIPAKDRDAWSAVFVGLNLAVPVIEKDLNGLVGLQSKPTPIPASAVTTP